MACRVVWRRTANGAPNPGLSRHHPASAIEDYPQKYDSQVVPTILMESNRESSCGMCEEEEKTFYCGFSATTSVCRRRRRQGKRNKFHAGNCRALLLSVTARQWRQRRQRPPSTARRPEPPPGSKRTSNQKLGRQKTWNRTNAPPQPQPVL